VDPELADGDVTRAEQRFTDYFLIYDYDTVIQTLIRRDGMDEEGAVEFFEFNVIGAWVGDATPCFLRTSL
jgi:hypothetical protein